MASTLQTKIREWLKDYAISWIVIKDGKEVTEYAIQVNSSGRRGKHKLSAPIGWADIDCVLKNGISVYIEVKEERDTLRDSQIVYGEAMRQHGVHVFTARSLDNVKNYFRVLGVIKEI